MSNYNVGDKVKYQTAGVQTIYYGYSKSQIKIGKILEYFPNLSGSETCFWIDGEDELILKSQIIGRVSDDESKTS